MQTSNKQTKVLILPTSFSHFINKDPDMEQQHKRAEISNFSNEIVAQFKVILTAFNHR